MGGPNAPSRRGGSHPLHCGRHHEAVRKDRSFAEGSANGSSRPKPRGPVRTGNGRNAPESGAKALREPCANNGRRRHSNLRPSGRRADIDADQNARLIVSGTCTEWTEVPAMRPAGRLFMRLVTTPSPRQAPALRSRQGHQGESARPAPAKNRAAAATLGRRSAAPCHRQAAALRTWQRGPSARIRGTADRHSDGKGRVAIRFTEAQPCFRSQPTSVFPPEAVSRRFVFW